MPATMSPQIARQALRFALRRFREEAEYNQAETAKHMGLAQSTYAAFESGTKVISKPQLHSALVLFNKLNMMELMEALQRTAAVTDRSQTEPLTVPGLKGFDLMLGLEHYATEVEIFEPNVVTGLLQTERYARHLLEQTRETQPSLDVDHALALRMERQEVLTRPEDGPLKPVNLTTIMPEWSLRRAIRGVSKDVLVEQLDHLVEVGGRRNVKILIIPASVGYDSAMGSLIMMFRWGEALKVVYMEDRNSGHYYSGQDAVNDQARLFTTLTGIAIGERESIRLISDIREELRSS